jgi:hypothetical protein
VTVVSVTYERCLGPVERLVPGEWTQETMTGGVALCCKECGQVYDLGERHRIEENGFVVPAVRCGSGPCSAFSYINLANYSDPVVPA